MHTDGADIGEVGEELQSAVAMLRTDPAGGPAVELLTKVLRNIVASPSEAKFRCQSPSSKQCPGGVCAGTDVVSEADMAHGLHGATRGSWRTCASLYMLVIAVYTSPRCCLTKACVQ